MNKNWDVIIVGARCSGAALGAANPGQVWRPKRGRVTVVTPPNDEDHVDYVVYAAHKGTFRYSASQLRFAPGTTRPGSAKARLGK